MVVLANLPQCALSSRTCADSAQDVQGGISERLITVVTGCLNFKVWPARKVGYRESEGTSWYLQATPPRTRTHCAVAVRCHLGAASTSQPGDSSANSKCPVMRLVNGTKGLLRSSAPAVEAPSRHFSYDLFDYTPFSATNYQVCNFLPNYLS